MCSLDGHLHLQLNGDDSPFYSRIFDTFCADVPFSKTRHDKVKVQQQHYIPFAHLPRPALFFDPNTNTITDTDPSIPRGCVRPTTDLPRVPGGQVFNVKKRQRQRKPHGTRDQNHHDTLPHSPMDASNVFRQVQGFGTYIPRPPQTLQLQQKKPVKAEDPGDGEASHRIAHTLTACCRCRQVSLTVSRARYEGARITLCSCSTSCFSVPK